MAESSPTNIKRTISFIDEDELQLHKLYRERIVQEDNIINHRMMWMVLSQAFLLATFGAIAQKIYSQTPENLFTAARVICVSGMILGIGSKYAIRAAQDEIEELRAKYIKMFPPAIDDIEHGYFFVFWMNFFDFRTHRHQEAYAHVSQIKEKGSIYLPGLTGSRNFHLFGHMVPKTVPAVLITLWVFLFFNVKRDIGHLIDKHWSTYFPVIIGSILGVWFLPFAAKQFTNWLTNRKHSGYTTEGA